MSDYGGAAALRNEDAILELYVAKILAEARVITWIVGGIEHDPRKRGEIEFPDVI